MTKLINGFLINRIRIRIKEKRKKKKKRNPSIFHLNGKKLMAKKLKQRSFGRFPMTISISTFHLFFICGKLKVDIVKRYQTATLILNFDKYKFKIFGYYLIINNIKLSFRH